MAIAVDPAIKHHFESRHQNNAGSKFVRQGVVDALNGRDFCPGTDNPYWMLFYNLGYGTAARHIQDKRQLYRYGKRVAEVGLVGRINNKHFRTGYESECEKQLREKRRSSLI